METKKYFISTLIWLVLLMVTPLWVFAQDQPTKFRQEELGQMLAPVALYPDSLLAQILMASTYPLEVVQADRWVKANRNLKGDPLNDALDKKDWDPSVKALVPFPQVLSMMSEKLEWTQRLGDAFLDQQDEVMGTIQQLRAKAQAAGNLRDTEEQRVTAEEGTIMIEPAQPEVIYVPAYDPTLVYGPWWYPAFPPFFFLPPPRVVVFGRIGFWTGVRVGRAWGHAWGYWDWRNHHVNVNVNRHININRNVSISRTSIQTTPWQLDVRHRKGVSYRNEATRERYGQSLKGAENRRDFRGFGQVTGLPQASGVTRQSLPATKSQQASGGTRQILPETKSQQVPGATSQGLGRRIETGGLDPQRLDRSSGRTAFGGTERGSDVRRESDRGRQSLQDMSSRGRGSVDRGNVGRGR